MFCGCQQKVHGGIGFNNFFTDHFGAEMEPRDRFSPKSWQEGDSQCCFCQMIGIAVLDLKHM